MHILNRVRSAAQYWSENNAPRRSAALTYYALASLAPMLVLLLSIAGLFFTPERVADALTGPISVAIGSENARSIQNILENAYNPGGNITAGVFSILVTIVTGSELFRRLSLSLNEFLQHEQESSELDAPDPSELEAEERVRQAVLRVLRQRLRAFLIVLGAGLLLITGLAASTLLGAGQEYLSNFVDFPFGLAAWGSRAFTLAFVTILFGLTYSYATRRDLDPASAWQGAFIAGLIFTVLQEFLGAFLVSNRLNTTYGAAASLVVLLFWLYYSMQVLFFGAAWAMSVSEGEG